MLETDFTLVEIGRRGTRNCRNTASTNHSPHPHNVLRVIVKMQMYRFLSRSARHRSYNRTSEVLALVFNVIINTTEGSVERILELMCARNRRNTILLMQGGRGSRSEVEEGIFEYLR